MLNAHSNVPCRHPLTTNPSLGNSDFFLCAALHLPAQRPASLVQRAGFQHPASDCQMHNVVLAHRPLPWYWVDCKCTQTRESILCHGGWSQKIHYHEARYSLVRCVPNWLAMAFLTKLFSVLRNDTVSLSVVFRIVCNCMCTENVWQTAEIWCPLPSYKNTGHVAQQFTFNG